jgi:hypothetical protein
MMTCRRGHSAKSVGPHAIALVVAGLMLLLAAPSLAQDKKPDVSPPASNAQQAPMNTKAPSQSAPEYQITEFNLLRVTPDPVIVGGAAIAEFDLVVQYGRETAARSAIDEMMGRLAVAIETGSLVRGDASVRSWNVISARSGGQFGASIAKVSGSFVFNLNTDIRSSFFGVNWGSSHALYLSDRQTGLRSNPVSINVRSPRIVQIGLLSGGTAFVGLVGLLAFRLLRAPPERDPPVVIPAPRAALDEEPRPVLPLPEVPPSLLAALSEGKGLLVVGGGASAQAGFPNGPAFLGQLVERLRADLPDSLIHSVGGDSGSARMGATGDGFNKVMDAIVSSKVERERIAREMQKILADVRPDRTMHNRLGSLPWRGAISLTWDTLADDILVDADRGWRKFALDQAGELPAALKSGQRPFLRPLGDLERPDTLSLSIAEFRRNLTRWPDFQRQIGLMLQTESFLFVGVGPDTLQQFLQAVGGDLEVSGERHFALVPDSSENGLLSATLARFGVVLLPYTADHKHQAVSDFVSQLAKSARAAPASKSGSRTAHNEFTNSRIEAIKLTNISLFDNLELKFQTQIPGVDGAAWTVIFGPNGCGKSSILRAIGLALCGNEASAAGGRLLQVGKSDGSIELHFGAQLVRTRLVRNRDVSVTPSSTTPVQGGLALVLGFPALRGAPSTNPKGVAPLETRVAEPADLIPLVNGEVDRRLGNFKQWLINVLEQAGRGDSRAIAKKTLIDDIIREVVPGVFRKLAPLDSSYVIRVKMDDKDTPSPSDVPFDDLSQGMGSIFNWLGVLVQRMYDFYPEAPEPQKLHAITLIDEIDAHLHPDWQRRLVELSKKFFPNVQVIATSHSPLLAGALRGKEMCVLERDRRTGRVAPLKFDVDFYGRSSQEILTSVVFGLQSDRNPETERLIHRYYDLFEKVDPTVEEKKELAELNKKLSNVAYGAVPPKAVPEDISDEEIDDLRMRVEQVRERGASTAGTAS